MKTSFLLLKPPLLQIFISLACGISLGNFCPDLSTSEFFVLLFCIILFLFLFIKKQRSSICIVLLIPFYLGFCLIQQQFYPEIKHDHVKKYLNSGQYEISGKIVSFPKTYRHKIRVTLSCITIKTANTTIPVTGKIYLNIYHADNLKFKIYDFIEFKGKIKSVRNFQNPGAFDYEKFLRYKKIYGTAYANYKKISILKKDHSFYENCIRSVFNLRDDFCKFAETKANDTVSADILNSLVCGKKELISNNTRDIFSKAGISHLLAISGIHLSIVGFLFYNFFYFLLAFNKKLLLSGTAKKIAGIITLLPLFIYVMFSGFSPSSQRAFLMAAVFLFSIVCENETDLISSLSAAGIIILFIDPAALFSISFQLSFSAVYFIVSGFQIIDKFKFRPGNKFVSRISTMLLVTFFAGIGTSPLTAYYFNIISHIQLITNLFAVPLICFVALPSGLLSLIFFKTFPVLSAMLIHMSSKLIFILFSISEYLINLPLTWQRIHSFGLLQVVITYLFLLSLFFWFVLKNKFPKLLFCSFLAFIIINSVAANNKLDPSVFKMTVLDVGQGSSSFIKTNGNKNILVDGGGFSSMSSFDTGRSIVAPFLWKNNISHIDYVILTHPEADHINGLIFILDNFKVNTLIKNSDSKSNHTYKKLMDLCNKKGIKIVIPCNNTDTIKVGELLSFEFFGLQKEDYNLNDNSLVFKLSFKKFSILFAGDILKKREKQLTNTFGELLESNILISPHHGSSSSSNKFFLEKVSPQSIIIQCGWQNRYRFPHKRIIKRYQKMGVNIYRTDTNGAVFIKSDGTNYNITTYTGG